VFPRRVSALLSVGALVGCQIPEVAPLEAADPAATLAPATGVAAQIAFHVQSEPDDAAPAGPALTLADALRDALVHDPRIQQALAKWRGARAASEEARLLPNPLLSVGVMLARAVSDATVTVGITQEIAAYLQRPHKAGAADARLRAAAEAALVAALDVVAETRAAYLAAQEADARRPSIEERLGLLTRLRDIHAESLREGEGVPSDVTALDAERAAIELDLAELDADRVRARIELARLVGRPSDPGAWRMDAWPALPPAAGDARPWIERALVGRAEARAIGWELAALGEDRELISTWPWEGASAGAEIEYDEGLALGPAARRSVRPARRRDRRRRGGAPSPRRRGASERDPRRAAGARGRSRRAPRARSPRARTPAPARAPTGADRDDEARRRGRDHDPRPRRPRAAGRALPPRGAGAARPRRTNPIGARRRRPRRGSAAEDRAAGTTQGRDDSMNRIRRSVLSLSLLALTIGALAACGEDHSGHDHKPGESHEGHDHK
jgi:hypothetical protein